MDAEQHEQLVGAALYGATDDEARSIIERELVAAGIPYVLEGSVVNSVQVPPEHLQRAIETLRSTPDLQRHWMQFADDEQDGSAGTP